MVIDRGAFLSGRYAKVYDEIVQVKEACGDAHLKVILETGELGTYDNVRRATLLAIAAGADFVKTSTGKISPAATLPVALCMLEAIRDVYEETGRRVGFKAAGGIRQAKQAVQHLVRRARDPRAGLADARSVPARRLVATQRHPDAAAQGAHRRLPERRLLHPGLKMHGLVTQATQSRDSLAPKLAPSHKGGGWVWGTRSLALRPPATVAGAGVAELDKPRREVDVPGDWTYASAPESRDIVHIRDRYGYYVGGEWLEPAETYETIAPRDEEPLAAVGQATTEDVGRAVAAARYRLRRRLVVAAGLRAREVPLPHRAPPPGALARVRRARVAQRRQADQGVARRRPPARRSPLLLLRRLGRQARVRLPEPAPAPGRRRRADHPLELPAPHARVEGRARARVRQHGRPQARRDDPAHGAPLLRRAAPGGAAAPASSTSSPGTVAPAPRSSRARTSTRSRSPARPRWGRRSSGGSPAPASG